jgi:phage-related protein (TIGR01555 family)
MTTPKTPAYKADSFANMLTGLATAKDKSSFGLFLRRAELDTDTLNDLYEQDAMAARVVDRLVDDGTREGFTIKGEDEAFDFASVQSELEDLDALNAVADAWRWSRLYGGALLVMVVNDGRKMSQPLNLNSATKLASLQVVESPFVRPTEFNPGLGARAFRRPEFYDLTVNIGSKKNDDRQIHRSRVIRFDGVRVAPARMIESDGWGPSVLDRVYEEISSLGEVMGYCRSVMHDISIQVYKLQGLRERLCGGAESVAEMRAVMETIRYGVDNLHVLALDTEDDFMEVNRNVSGLEMIVNKFVDAVVRATPYPRTVILGESPSGLNANGDTEIRSYFDFVASQQRLTLTPGLTRLLEVIFAIRSNKGEQVPDEFTIDYRPLYRLTDQEQAETILKRSQADQVYMLNSVMSPDEVRARLISSGELVPLEAPDDIREPPEEEPEEGDDPDELEPEPAEETPAEPEEEPEDDGDA